MKEVNCKNCSKKILRTNSRAKGNCFCGHSCHLLYYYDKFPKCKKVLTRNCKEGMRKKIERVGYLVPIENRKFGDDNYSRNPEFRKWLSETRRGKNNPNWDKHTNFLGGKTEYRGFDWRTAKKASKQRDDYRCVSCGMTEEEHIAKCGQGLQIDHIIPYKVSKDNSLNNLQTLCSLCHGKKWKHDYYVIKEAVSLV